jgi:hypothetical protein
VSNLSDAAIPVQRYVESYRLQAFIETGCYLGGGLDVANRLGLELYSCDLNEAHVERCRDRFPAAHVYVTDSVTFLRDVCPWVERPTLFWLDAHFPRQPRSPRDRWPLFDELTAIKTLRANVERDVILCDDLMVIGSEDNARYRPGECEHVNMDHTLIDYIALLLNTHEVELIHEETGVLAFLPRGR